MKVGSLFSGVGGFDLGLEAAGMTVAWQAQWDPELEVRRLTPRECERLMGWPDDHTRWTDDGQEIADSHRYRMCGNGVVAPVAEAIGRLIVAADTAAREAT